MCERRVVTGVERGCLLRRAQSGAFTDTPSFANWAIRQNCTTSLWVTSDPNDQLSVNLDCARANYGGFTVPTS